MSLCGEGSWLLVLLPLLLPVLVPVPFTVSVAAVAAIPVRDGPGRAGVSAIGMVWDDMVPYAVPTRPNESWGLLVAAGLVLLVARGWSGVGLGSFLCCFSCCGGRGSMWWWCGTTSLFFCGRCGFRCGGGGSGAWWLGFSAREFEAAECGH